MANPDGVEACKEAYVAGIAHFNDVLITNLAEAKTEAEKQDAIDKFKRGVLICKQARQICEQEA